MSIRLGIYDFFAYTIPGLFFLLIAAYTAVLFGWIPVDITFLNDISLLSALLLTGVGYVIGVLMSRWSERWRQICDRRSVKERAYKEFQARHQWLTPKFAADEWYLVLSYIRRKGDEYVAEIERFNVYYIMVRNISFGLIVLAVIHLFYFAVTFTMWSLAATIILGAFSWISIHQAIRFCLWFYESIYDTAAVDGLKATDLFEFDELTQNRSPDEANCHANTTNTAQLAA